MATVPNAAANPATDFGLRLNFFKITVKDVDAMVAFYTGAFGFEEQNRIALPGLVEVMLALPKQQFNLVLYHWTDGREITIGNGYGPIGLLTKNVDAACDHAVKFGAQLTREPFDLSNMRIAFLVDPEGHELELITFTPPV
jgi:lactoylglutathione lyase